MSPGYGRDDELWTQDTVVFKAVSDDFEPVDEQQGAGAGKSPVAKYVIIALVAAVAASVVTLGGVYLYKSFAPGTGASAPLAAPVTTTAARVVTTTKAVVAPTTTSASPTPSTTTKTTTVLPTTTASGLAAFGATCDQPGQKTKSASGVVLTCDVAGDSGLLWLDLNTPVSGSVCDEQQLGYFGRSAKGVQLLCSPVNGAPGTGAYAWAAPSGRVSTGAHEAGQPCNLQQDVMGMNSAGRAVTCKPLSGSTNRTVGEWWMWS